MAVTVDAIEPGTILRYEDLRDYIEIVDALGELRRANGPSLHLEIGAICALSREATPRPRRSATRSPAWHPGFGSSSTPTLR
jgi:hypothetical protein